MYAYVYIAVYADATHHNLRVPLASRTITSITSPFLIFSTLPTFSRGGWHREKEKLAERYHVP